MERPRKALPEAFRFRGRPDLKDRGNAKGVKSKNFMDIIYDIIGYIIFNIMVDIIGENL